MGMAELRFYALVTVEYDDALEQGRARDASSRLF
jgi:hypothetical protein